MTIEPSAEILAFIERQAEPIRDNIYFHIAAGLSPDVFMTIDSWSSLTKDFLKASTPMQSMYRCAMVMGALDYGFSTSADASEKAVMAMDDEILRRPQFQRALLSLPLNRRYLQQAAIEWEALRGSALSHAALNEYLATHAGEWVDQGLTG